MYVDVQKSEGKGVFEYCCGDGGPLSQNIDNHWFSMLTSKSDVHSAGLRSTTMPLFQSHRLLFPCCDRMAQLADNPLDSDVFNHSRTQAQHTNAVKVHLSKWAPGEPVTPSCLQYTGLSSYLQRCLWNIMPALSRERDWLTTEYSERGQDWW